MGKFDEHPWGISAIAIKGTGVTVKYVEIERLKVDGAPVEVVQYADQRGLEVRVCLASPPQQLLHCLDEVEAYVDDLDQLGEWRNGGRWRGVVLTGWSRR